MVVNYLNGCTTIETKQKKKEGKKKRERIDILLLDFSLFVH